MQVRNYIVLEIQNHHEQELKYKENKTIVSVQMRSWHQGAIAALEDIANFLEGK